jgi:hypothetical protein
MVSDGNSDTTWQENRREAVEMLLIREPNGRDDWGERRLKLELKLKRLRFASLNRWGGAEVK